MLKEFMEIKHLLEHSDYLIIEKPPGLSVHNETAREASVLSLLGPHLHLVHRLDRETSGLLLLAKNKAAASELATQFQNHSVQKIYQAILRGALPQPQIHWQWPLTDKAEGRRNPQGLASDRKACSTEGQVVRKNSYVTQVEVQIKTGRQHQIRKHAALAKHPILGDGRYNDPNYNEKIAERFQTTRLFLHACRLEFQWKGSLQKIQCSLPEEFEAVFR